MAFGFRVLLEQNKQYEDLLLDVTEPFSFT